MGSVSHNSNDDANKYFIKIDFGVVPVGSIHKRTIDITNDLKASVYEMLFDVILKIWPRLSDLFFIKSTLIFH